MYNSVKMSIDKMTEAICNKKFVYLTSSSFEERSLYLAQKINLECAVRALIFSTDSVKKIEENRFNLEKVFGNKSVTVNLFLNNSVENFQAINQSISQIIEDGDRNLVVDITTFTHENLLMLLKILDRKKSFFDQIDFLYLSAKEYSLGDKNEKKWLSKGCKEVRTILGFPGVISPKKQNCLIVLVGFEHERAISLIEDMEPELLILGNGKEASEYVTEEEHLVPMKFFNQLHNSLLTSIPGVQRFEFYANNIDETRRVLKEVIEETPDCNHIVVPLNTKISTVATGLIALENESIQLCYAEPEMYNCDAYSSPSDNVTWFRFK